MVPGERAGSGSDVAVLGGNGLDGGLPVVPAVQIVAHGEEALLGAPLGNQGKLGLGHQMPALALVRTGLHGVIVCDLACGIYAGQGAGVAVPDGVAVLGDINGFDLSAVYKESGMDPVAVSYPQLGVGHFGNFDHNGGQTLVVRQNLVVGAHRLERQICKLK